MSLVENDYQETLNAARQALQAYGNDGDPQSAQLHYGEHDELAEIIEEALDDVYRNYSSRLRDRERKQYRKQFARIAKRRFGDVLPRLTFDADDDKLPE